MGLRDGVRALHLRDADAAQRAGAAALRVPRHGGHDPLQLLLRRERRASSRRFWAPRTPSSPTRSTTPRSSTASGSARRQRLRYENGDMDDLEARLEESAGARTRMIATDGVFSMDGHIADLEGICDLAERHGALVMVDDSHAVGFVGPNGRGTPELHGVTERVDIVTGTLGKALGGAAGGYVSGRREIVEILRQRARPYLFSNSSRPARRRGGAEGPRARREHRPSCATGSGPTRPGSARPWAPRASTSCAGTHPIVPVHDGGRSRRRRPSPSASGRAASTRSASRSRSSHAARPASARSSRPPTPSTTSTSRWRSSRRCGTRSRPENEKRVRFTVLRIRKSALLICK